MASIKIADLFAQVGARVDVTQLNKFQQRLNIVTRQLLLLKRVTRTPLSPNTNIAAVRNLNTELMQTLRLARQIQGVGPIRVRRTGGAAGGGRGGGGRTTIGPGAGGFFGGAAAAAGAGRVPVLARNFVAGFGGALAIRKLFQASAAMQGIEVALAAITREGQTTQEVMDFLTSEADRLGFEFESSALEFAKLAAAGNAAGLSTQEIQELFIGAQEAARVFNLSASDTEGVLKAFTQIVSKGKVTAEELRNQLGDRLPAAVPIFAAALGVTTQELSQMLEKGEILANETLPKFGKQLRSTFAPQVAAAAQNITAQFNRFLNDLFFFLAEAGEAGLIDIFSAALRGMSNALKILTPIIGIMAKTLNILIAPIRALGRILERPLEVIPKLTSAFFGLIGLLLLLRTALFQVSVAWVVAFAPIIATAAGLSALVLLIEDWLVALEGGDSVLKRMSESTNVFSAVIGGSLINLGKFVQFMGQLAAAVVTGNFDELTASFNRFIESIRDFLGLTSASGLLTDILESVLLDTTPLNANIPITAGAGAGPAPLVTSVELTVIDGAGLTEKVDVRVDSAMDRANRQAQAEFGNNE